MLNRPSESGGSDVRRVSIERRREGRCIEVAARPADLTAFNPVDALEHTVQRRWLAVLVDLPAALADTRSELHATHALGLAQR